VDALDHLWYSGAWLQQPHRSHRSSSSHVGPARRRAASAASGLPVSFGACCGVPPSAAAAAAAFFGPLPTAAAASAATARSPAPKARAPARPPPSFRLAPDGSITLRELIGGLGGRPCRLALDSGIPPPLAHQWAAAAARSRGAVAFDAAAACVSIAGNDALPAVVFYGAAAEGGAVVNLVAGGRMVRARVQLPPGGCEPAGYTNTAAAAVIAPALAPSAPKKPAAAPAAERAKSGSSSGSSPRGPCKLAAALLPPPSFQMSPDGSLPLSALIVGLAGRSCRLALSAPAAPAVAAAAHARWRAAAERSGGAVTYDAAGGCVLIAGREDWPAVVFYAQLAEGGAVVDLVAGGARVRTRVVVDDAAAPHHHAPKDPAAAAAAPACSCGAAAAAVSVVASAASAGLAADSGLALAVAAARGSGTLKAAVAAAMGGGGAAGGRARRPPRTSSQGGGAPALLASRESRS
jgi:hypothetical protein